MKKKLIIKIAIIFCTISISLNAQDGGQSVFVAKCAPCHTIGNGRLVGPDLKGVHKKYNLKYLETWIRSSQSVINGGNAKAKALFEEFNSIVMPDFPELKSDEIKKLANYIKAQSGDTDTKETAAAPATATTNATTVAAADIATPAIAASTTEAPAATNQTASNQSSTTAQPAVTEVSTKDAPSKFEKIVSLPFFWLLALVGCLTLAVILVLSKVVIQLSAMKK